MSITFRTLTEKADLQALEALEASIWSEASVIPLHMTLTLAKFGGLFIGAYDADKPIGFLYSFPGFSEGAPHLCSHMLGFLPAYRKRGLGVQMKWLQREEALKMGHRKITWTYDPLETVNGYLNIGKLGGLVRRYLPNCYGELNDEMNRGLPTDRFLVEWFIDSKRVEHKAQGRPAPARLQDAASVLDAELIGDFPRPAYTRLDAGEKRLAIPVPAQFQALKKADMGLAAEWREATRTLFTHYFGRGYVVTGIHREPDLPVVHYLLENNTLESVLTPA